MKPLSGICGAAAALALASAMADSEIPGQDAYAWRFPIQIDKPAEFISIEVPLEVYRSVTDPELRDLGVYNAAGQAVPRIVKQQREQAEDVEYETALGIVPLYGEMEASQERLRLLMQSNEAGTTLQFDSEVGDQSDPEPELRALIVDLRDVEESFSALDFGWAEDARGFIGTVMVEEGDDLAVWRRLARGSLASLEFEGTRIERNRIEFPREHGDFLRVTWRDMPQDWRLENVSGIRRKRGPEQSREWLDLDPAEVSDDGREFVFDIAGAPPVDRVNLILPRENVVVRASLDYRHDEESGWRQAHEGLFYRVSSTSNEITSTPAATGTIRAAQWRLRIHTGRASGDVRLRVGWLPERLLFLSQGEPPFTLACGRAQDRIEHFPQNRLLGDRAIFSVLDHAGEAGQARIGERQEAAGAMVMEGARTWTLRTIAVWIGLIAAVLFVGWLAWSLMREAK